MPGFALYRHVCVCNGSFVPLSQDLAADEAFVHGEWDDLASSRRPRLRCELP